MTDATPDDFDASDGWNDEKGVERCPCCEREYHPNGGYVNSVYNQNGREYDTYLDTDPGKGPFFCGECWPELWANQQASKHRGLGEFA